MAARSYQEQVGENFRDGVQNGVFVLSNLFGLLIIVDLDGSYVGFQHFRKRHLP
jgi:hypothetical protein